MSSTGINAVNSGPLIIRTVLDSSINNTYVVGKYDFPISSNYVLTTSTNGLLAPTNTPNISAITVSSLLDRDGSAGSAGEVLHTDGSTTYWAPVGAGSGYWSETGNTIYNNNTGGNVVIGASVFNISTTLYVKPVYPNYNEAVKVELNGSNLNVYKSTVNAVDATFVNNTGGGQLVLGTLTPSIFINGSNGNVGIQNAVPSYALDVEGNGIVHRDNTTSTIISMSAYSDIGHIDVISSGNVSFKKGLGLASFGGPIYLGSTSQTVYSQSEFSCPSIINVSSINGAVYPPADGNTTSILISSIGLPSNPYLLDLSTYSGGYSRVNVTAKICGGGGGGNKGIFVGASQGIGGGGGGSGYEAEASWVLPSNTKLWAFLGAGGTGAVYGVPTAATNGESTFITPYNLSSSYLLVASGGSASSGTFGNANGGVGYYGGGGGGAYLAPLSGGNGGAGQISPFYDGLPGSNGGNGTYGGNGGATLSTNGGANYVNMPATSAAGGGGGGGLYGGIGGYYDGTNTYNPTQGYLGGGGGGSWQKITAVGGDGGSTGGGNGGNGFALFTINPF